jgi:hypothetical protein
MRCRSKSPISGIGMSRLEIKSAIVFKYVGHVLFVIDARVSLMISASCLSLVRCLSRIWVTTL